DGPTGAVLERHGAALREAGCWLPRELEERLGNGGEVADRGRVTAAAAEPMLTVRHADLGHVGRSVLTGVDLAVHAGQLLAVVGRNGAGKSTLLGALSRLDAPLGGEI